MKRAVEALAFGDAHNYGRHCEFDTGLAADPP